MYLCFYPNKVFVFFPYSLILGQSFPLFETGERSVNLNLDLILFPILYLTPLFRLNSNKNSLNRSYFKRPLFISIFFLFNLWMFVSFFYNFLQIDVSDKAFIIQYAKWFLYSLVFLPYSRVFFNNEQIIVVIKHFFFASLICLFIGYFQFLTINRSESNIVSTFGSIFRNDSISTKNAFGIFMVISLIVLSFQHHKVFGNKIKYYSLFMLYFLIIIFSFSRSAIAGLVFVVFLNCISKFYFTLKDKLISKQTLSLFLVASIIFITSFIWSAIGNFNEHTPIGRLLRTFKGNEDFGFDESVATRINLLLTSFNDYLSSKIFLLGFGFNLRIYTAPILSIVDNFYLDVLLDTGILGLILLLLLLLSIIIYFQNAYKAIAISKDNNYIIIDFCKGAYYSIIALCVAAISSSVPFNERILGTMSVFVAIVYSFNRINKK